MNTIPSFSAYPCGREVKTERFCFVFDEYASVWTGPEKSDCRQKPVIIENDVILSDNAAGAEVSSKHFANITDTLNLPEYIPPKDHNPDISDPVLRDMEIKHILVLETLKSLLISCVINHLNSIMFSRGRSVRKCIP